MKRTNEELEKLLAVFRRDTLENFFTLSKYLKDNNSSPKEIGRYLSWKRKQVEKARKLSEEDNAKRRRKADGMMAKWQEKVAKCPKGLRKNKFTFLMDKLSSSNLVVECSASARCLSFAGRKSLFL